MQARMKNPGAVIPGAMTAITALNEAIKQRRRTTQDTRPGTPASQPDQRLQRVRRRRGQCQERRRDRPTTVHPGRLAGHTLLHRAQRAALALTEAVTRLSDRTDPVPDEIWNEAARHYDEPALAALVLWIAVVNVFNRVNVATRQVPGKHPG
jgi:alkylhydroperoxidase family enzyme